MVAQTMELPNLRKMFVPDEGYTMLDVDLERADAQVVAWDAEDEELKQIFREGLDIHTENARMIFSGWAKGSDAQRKEWRQKAKAGVHAVNYGVRARTLSATLQSTVKEAEDFINSWYSAHPKIKEWHETIQQGLEEHRSVRNAFGYRMVFFDRVDQLLPKALAWIPQSSVGLATNFGLLNIDENIPEAELLLQVHDSLVLQIPTNREPELCTAVREQMLVPVPYDDPLTIPVNVSLSRVSWGDCEKTVYKNGSFYWQSPFEKKDQLNPVWDEQGNLMPVWGEDVTAA